LDCFGCHNPEAKDPQGGVEMSTQEIIDLVDRGKQLDGVTFSGGEPFMQSIPLAYLGKEIKKRELHLVTYTGYTFENLWYQSAFHKPTMELLEVTDVLVDGPYLQEEREPGLPFRGSRNQRVIDVASSIEEGYPVAAHDSIWKQILA